MTLTNHRVRDPFRASYDDLILEDRVHGSVYTDPEIFEDEMAKIFSTGWVYVGHESQVPQPGDYHSGYVGRQPVIMVRGDDGQVRIFMNRCAHRAAMLCQDAGSTRFFKCAYHGWSFSTEGQLVGVPYPKGYGDSFRKEDFGLTPVPRVDDYRGLVFASLADHGISLDEHLGEPTKRQIDLFIDLSPEGQIDCKTAGTARFTYRGNWKLQLENTVDLYHINFLHESLVDTLEKRQGVNIVAMSNDSSPARNVALGKGHTFWDIRPFNESNPALREQVLQGRNPDEADYAKLMRERHGEERAKELLTIGGTHLAIFPNAGLLSGVIRQFRPIDVDFTEVILTPAMLVGVPDSMNTARLRAYEAFFPPAGMGGTDDQEIFERQQMGLQAQVNPWLLVARGLDREETRSDGTVSSQATDETNTRAIFRHWKSLMQADEEIT